MNPRALLFVLAVIASLGVSQLQADLFISGEVSSSIQRYDGVTGASEGTFVQGGQTYSPQQATGVAFGPDGNLYVVGASSGEVLRYNGNTGAAMPSPTNNPFGADFTTGFGMSGAQFVAFGPDLTNDLYPDIYVTNQNNVTVYNGSTGAFIQNFTLFSNNPQNSNPSFSGIAVGADGMLYMSDLNGSPFDNFANSVVRLDPHTGIFSTFVANGSGGLNSPTGLTFGPDGNLYVAGSAGGPGIGAQVTRYNPVTGAFISTFVPLNNNGGMQLPQGLVFGPDGNLYVTSSFHNPATMFTPGTSTFVARFSGVTGAYVDQFATGSDMDAFFGLAFSNLVAVPEPGTTAIGGVTALALVLRLRRRKAD